MSTTKQLTLSKRVLNPNDEAANARSADIYKQVTAATNDVPLQLALGMVMESVHLRQAGLLPKSLIPNVVGNSSTGKSLGLKLAAEKLGWQVEIIKTASIQEIEALLGYISPAKEDSGHAVHAEPAWVLAAREAKKAGRIFLVILDDLTRTKNPQLVHALLDLGETLSFNTLTLPDNVHFVVTTNPDSADYNVAEEDMAQKNRYAIIPHGSNFDSVEQIAHEQGWPEETVLTMATIKDEFLQKEPVMPSRELNKRTAALLARTHFLLAQFPGIFRESILTLWGGPTYKTAAAMLNGPDNGFAPLTVQQLLNDPLPAILNHFTTADNNNRGDSRVASFYILGRHLSRLSADEVDASVIERLAELTCEMASDAELLWTQLTINYTVGMGYMRQVEAILRRTGRSTSVLQTIVQRQSENQEDLRGDA